MLAVRLTRTDSPTMAEKLGVGLADQRECGADGSREVVHPRLSFGARHDVSGASISGLRR